MEYDSLKKKRQVTLAKIHGRASNFIGVSECLSREDTMEPIKPKKSSSRPSSSRPGSSRSRRSGRSGSQSSDSKEKKAKAASPTELEKEVTFDDEPHAEGYIVEDSDSDGSDLDQEGDEALDVAFDEDVEPYVDEEAVKAELGGDPEEQEHTAPKTDDGGEEKDSKEDEEDEEKGKKAPKKKSRRLKKTTETRTGFDGREVIFVTEFTQTDWKWKDNVQRSGRGNIVSPTPVKPESRQTTSQARTDEGSTLDDRTTTDLTPFSLQPNDEFGIPMLDMSSDSDSSDGESPKKMKVHKHHLPSIGPPKILKYIRESDRLDKDTDKASSDFDDEYRQLDSADYVLDEQGNAVGMFSGPCEFCGDNIKPFPTLDQQLSQPPESLYCCEDYREFVEFAMTTATRLEEDVAKKNEKISVKVHGHHGSKQARKMAKEQAVQRMRERELQRRQQEASGMQAAFYQSGASGQGGGASRGPKGGQPGGAMMYKDMDSDRSEELPGVDTVAMSRTFKRLKQKGIIGRGGGNGGEGRRGGRIGAAWDKFMGGRPMLSARREGGDGVGGSRVTHRFSLGMPQGSVSSFTSYGPLNTSVARQMKTINYQLSSQRCLEEGWTLRAPSPLDLDDLDNEVFVPEPLHPAMIASGKLHGRPLIEKFYPDGSKFLTMFPDGTGNVFYPSGRLAIMISSISLGQNTYIVQDDCNEPEILGVFEPNGYGCCYFANGKVRLTYDQIGGLELDYTGGRKRTWSWKDQETHVHAPPFQPIVFGMNRFLGIRFMAQESIALTLTGRKRSCRFNVGAKLKLVAPENILPKGIDEHQLFIGERKVRVDTILNKVTNLLKFPKSPKVDRMLPPLAVSAKQQKMDKMRQDYMAALPATPGPGRKPRKIVKQTRLSPLDPPNVVQVN